MALRQNICVLLTFAAVCQAGDRASKRPMEATELLKTILKPFAFAVTGSVTVTPATITFTSPDPDTTPVNGSSTATISWKMNGGTNSWTLGVNAAAASFTSCPLVSLSAVKFTCSSATPGGGGSPTASCASGTFTLSTSQQTIASGTHQGNGAAPFTVVVAYTFTDAWKYPANSSCSLNLTYTATGI
jgi:hypothetical protein